jgi:hypothetical protein
MCYRNDAFVDCGFSELCYVCYERGASRGGGLLLLRGVSLPSLPPDPLTGLLPGNRRGDRGGPGCAFNDADNDEDKEDGDRMSKPPVAGRVCTEVGDMAGDMAGGTG